jgi:hypothetical protein
MENIISAAQTVAQRALIMSAGSIYPPKDTASENGYIGIYVI